MGRTGVHGRGSLIRWGPNKFIMAIITRCKRYNDQFITVDGQRVLEAIVFKDEQTNDWKFPTVSIHVNHQGTAIRSFTSVRAIFWVLSYHIVLCVEVLTNLHSEKTIPKTLCLRTKKR